jgi:DNA-binding response OmpR family regulator
MNLVTRTVIRAKTPITLTPKEFALLEYFLRNPRRPISRVNIAEHVWDVHFDSESNVIDVYMNMLRKKIDQPFESKILHTVVGFGYVLKEENELELSSKS